MSAIGKSIETERSVVVRGWGEKGLEQNASGYRVSLREDKKCFRSVLCIGGGTEGWEILFLFQKTSNSVQNW